jgi:hypothetical protein
VVRVRPGRSLTLSESEDGDEPCSDRDCTFDNEDPPPALSVYSITRSNQREAVCDLCQLSASQVNLVCQWVVERTYNATKPRREQRGHVEDRDSPRRLIRSVPGRDEEHGTGEHLDLLSARRGFKRGLCVW